MEDLIGMRQRYVLTEKKVRQERSKQRQELLNMLAWYLFGIAIGTIILFTISFLFKVTH
jgi:hypothetical protein